MLQKQIYMKYTLQSCRSKMLIDADAIILTSVQTKGVFLCNMSLKLNGSQ